MASQSLATNEYKRLFPLYGELYKEAVLQKGMIPDIPTIETRLNFLITSKNDKALLCILGLVVVYHALRRTSPILRNGNIVLELENTPTHLARMIHLALEAMNGSN